MAQKRNFINRLPDEVLSMVFDRLDFESLKNASLTCHRWNNAIFEGGCLERFLLVVDCRSPALSNRNPLKSLAPRIKLLTRHTTRRYRNLRITVVPGMENVFTTIWRVIHPKITSNIRWLYVGYIRAQMSDLLPLLIDSIPSLLHLQSLMVDEESAMGSGGFFSKIPQKQIPKIRSKSLQELGMRCSYRYTVDLPQLETFQGALSALNLPDDSSQSLMLSNLKLLQILAKNDDSINPTVFRRMPNLHSIIWDVPVDEALLIAMCETYPSLTRLQFSPNIMFTDRSLFEHLLKLTELRQLTFPAINVSQLVYDFSKFTHLKDLYLGNNEIPAVTFQSLPNSIRAIGLRLNPNNERNLMEMIPCKFAQLTELHMIFYDGPASQKILNILPSLKQLKRLSLTRCNFQRSFFLGMDTPLPQMRVLQFIYCTLPTERLLGLQEKFPNVKKPEFIHCFESLPTDVGDLESAFLRLVTYNAMR
ncbi:uncharacterized protein LOC126575637 isoform X2 [Anopheles aquasalis]|nr:uncharacterized protein LOC126575637 isoform X2 [Anopheles aquasalis]